LHPASVQGNLAVAAIIDYSSVLNMLVHVRNLSSETDSILRAITYQSNLISGNVDLSVISNLSNYLLNVSLGQVSEVQEVLASIDSTASLQTRAQNKTAGLNDIVVQLTSDVMIHNEATNLAVLEINQTLAAVANQLNEVHTDSVEVSSTSSLLLSATPLVMASINATQAVSGL
jgi:hypothetical protein